MQRKDPRQTSQVIINTCTDLSQQSTGYRQTNLFGPNLTGLERHELAEGYFRAQTDGGFPLSSNSRHFIVLISGHIQVRTTTQKKGTATPLKGEYRYLLIPKVGTSFVTVCKTSRILVISWRDKTSAHSNPVIGKGNLDDLRNVTPETGGWIIGFFHENALQKTSTIEVHWGNFSAGFSKKGSHPKQYRPTLALLTEGATAWDIGSNRVSLGEQFSYVLYDASAAPHTTNVLEDCKMINIRWPSTTN